MSLPTKFVGGKPAIGASVTTVNITGGLPESIYFKNTHGTQRVCITLGVATDPTCAVTDADYTNQLVLLAGESVTLTFTANTFKAIASGASTGLIWYALLRAI